MRSSPPKVRSPPKAQHGKATSPAATGEPTTSEHSLGVVTRAAARKISFCSNSQSPKKSTPTKRSKKSKTMDRNSSPQANDSTVGKSKRSTPIKSNQEPSTSNTKQIRGKSSPAKSHAAKLPTVREQSFDNNEQVVETKKMKKKSSPIKSPRVTDNNDELQAGRDESFANNEQTFETNKMKKKSSPIKSPRVTDNNDELQTGREESFVNNEQTEINKMKKRKMSPTKSPIVKDNNAAKNQTATEDSFAKNEQTFETNKIKTKKSPRAKDNNDELQTGRVESFANNEQPIETNKIRKKTSPTKSYIVEDNNDAEYITVQEGNLSGDKFHTPLVKSPSSPSKSTPTLDVPHNSNVKGQLLAGTCLITATKEEPAESPSKNSDWQPFDCKSECKEEIKEEDLVEHCLENSEINAEEISVRDTSLKELSEMQVEVVCEIVKPKSPEKKSSPVKKPMTPKKVIIEDKSETDDDSDAESRKEIMRSAEKRIIRNISTSESESRNVGIKQVKITGPALANIGPALESTGSESDSAPEDVAFDVSRKTAFDAHKIAEDSIKRDQQRKKDKRKERLELIRQRKEENLIRLKERRANLEDASCSSSEESVHEKNGQLYIDPLKVLGKKTYIFDDVDDVKRKSVGERPATGIKRLPSELLENLPDQPPKKKKTSHFEALDDVVERADRAVSKSKRDVDFIPVASSGSTQFGVVPLNKPQLKTVAQQAANFKHNMLYGRHIDRVNSASLKKSMEKKRKAIKVYK